METLLGLCVGVGLSAACGFRVFVPLLIMSIASYSGHLTLAPAFQWIASPAAIAAFSVATVLEVGGYYVPWIDHLLDAVSTPVAMVAGTIITASFVTEVSPFLQWTLAVVAGGGAAGVIQASTVALRGVSTAGTGGLANPVFATAELGGSLVTSLGALIAPLAVLLVLGAGLVFVAVKVFRFRASRAYRSFV